LSFVICWVIKVFGGFPRLTRSRRAPRCDARDDTNFGMDSTQKSPQWAKRAESKTDGKPLGMSGEPGRTRTYPLIAARIAKSLGFQAVSPRCMRRKWAVLGAVVTADVTDFPALRAKAFRHLFAASGEIARPSNRKSERKIANLLRTHRPSTADSK
jgi:hypothetical protein